MRAEGLSFEHPRSTRPAVRDVSFELYAGEVLALCGPNGAGKSTLLALCAGLLRPEAGRVTVLGDDLQALSQTQRAQRIARMPQELESWPRQTVTAFVSAGRYAHCRGSLDGLGASDRAIVDEALAAVGARQWGDRSVTELSGGERQRLLVARALAQQPRVLLCDEPTASLDIAAQLDVLEHLVAAALRPDPDAAPRAVLLVTHDLNLAAQFGDRILLLHDGAVRADGSPEDVLTPAVLEPLYGRSLSFQRLPAADGAPGAGRPLVFPRRRPRSEEGDR